MTENLVLIPGLLCDAVIWKHQADTLRARYDIRIPDLRRHSSIEDMAESVLAQTPARFSLAGHSMGARVAMEITRMAPERVDRLALLDTGIHPPREGEAARRQVLVDLGAGQGMRALADAWLPPMVAAGAFDRDPALRDELYAMVERMNSDIHRAQIAALLTRPDAGVGLAQICCPVLIGVGEADVWSPPQQHLEILEAVPHAAYVVFEGSGHMAPLEAPAAVTEALTDWMQTPLAR